MLVRQVGQQARQPLGEHRLAHPGRTVQEDVVPASGCDLDCPAGLRLPPHVGEVWTGSSGSGGAHSHVQVGLAQHRAPVQHLDQVVETGHSPDGDAADQLGLPDLRGRHDRGADAGLTGSEQRRQNATNLSNAPVETHFTDQHAGGRDAARHRAGSRQHCGNDGQIVMRAGLWQTGGGQVDGQQLRRP